MFENLTERLTRTLRGVAGKARLSEDNIGEALREVRTALLEADVALPVVRDFVDKVRARAIGTEVSFLRLPACVQPSQVQSVLILRSDTRA